VRQYVKTSLHDCTACVCVAAGLPPSASNSLADAKEDDYDTILELIAFRIAKQPLANNVGELRRTNAQAAATIAVGWRQRLY
jgi:hypothetical protein